MKYWFYQELKYKRGGIMAGNQLHANSQLMYYPTTELETLRMLGLIGNIKLKAESYARKYVLDEIKNKIGEDIYKEVYIRALDNSVDVELALYDYFIQTKQYDIISKCYTYYINPNAKTVTIADLQAGEGKWLRIFKDFIPYIDNNGEGNKHIKLIANELEDERYRNIKADYQYLGSFEDLQLPQESVSLLLFNPPYGETNGERNVRRYLRMTMERNLMAKGSYILMVIREDDARDVIDIFNKYFSAQLIYKTHEEEFNKFKQVVILGRKWSYPLDELTVMGAKDIQWGIARYLEKLDNTKEFQLSYYNNKISSLPEVNMELLMENFEYIINDKQVLSQNNNVWRHVKDLTELKDMGSEKLILPKTPKQGEIANLLASGQVNGTMEIEHNGKKYNHIVVGGVKTIEENEIIKHEDYTETKIIRYSKPYLNILITENGKYKVKELGVDV